MNDIYFRQERTDGTSSVPPVGTANASSTLSALMPVRKRPSSNSVMTYCDNRSIILFVTVVVDGRRRILANDVARDCIVAAWKDSPEWIVGRYVIMPDHVHFFCAPAQYPPSGFRRWMKRWKTLSAMSIRKAIGAANAGGSQLVATVVDGVADGLADGTSSVPPVGTAMAAIPVAGLPFWQRNCWDRQLRAGESYSEKWNYIRNNPVRKGLCDLPEHWPFQGEMHKLCWHDR